MLSRGLNVNSADILNRSLLHIACSKSDQKMVKLLLYHHAKLNSPDFEGNTPIHFAATAGHLRVIKLILKAAPPDRKLTIINTRNDAKDTPLHLAASYGNSKTVKYLLQQGAEVLPSKVAFLYTPLDFAIARGRVEVVRVLLNYVPDIASEQKYYILIFLAAAGDTSSNPKFRNSIDRKITKKLSFARQQQYIKIIDLLIKAGVHCQYSNLMTNPLHVAVKENHYFIVEKFLQLGINVNLVDRYGFCALKFAIMHRCDNDLIKLLLKKGADVTGAMYPYSYKLPIQMTFLRRNYEVLSTLITAGADINGKTFRGIRIFDNNHNYGPSDALYIYIILRYGADINAVGLNGYTAVYNLCPFYKFKEAAILFDWNLDFNFMSPSNETPLKYAVDKAYSLYSQEFIIKFIAKLQSHSNFEINPQIENIISEYNFLERLINYKAELEVLKERKVWGDVTFFEILSKPLHELREYARNSELVKAFNSGIRNKYLAYGDLIKARMDFALKLKNIHEKCIYALEKLAYPIRLPEIIAYEILSFLNVDDMLKLSLMNK